MAVVLLVLGIVVDLGFTQKRSQDVRRLARERAQLQEKLSNLESRDLGSQKLAAYFGVERLTELLDRDQRADPVTYVSDLLNESGLTRLELGTMATSEVGRLQRTEFYVRASGRYKRVLDFTRKLEQRPRLARVDALVLEQMVESSHLEARFNLSIYDPLVVE
jgi:hypothetical protein